MFYKGIYDLKCKSEERSAQIEKFFLDVKTLRKIIYYVWHDNILINFSILICKF